MNAPRALVGLDAKVIDVLVRLVGARYQRLLALGARKVQPRPVVEVETATVQSAKQVSA
jgi:hypothetical protein